MRGARAQAGLHPADVGHVNAHGTGTAKNDTIEARAIEAVFGAHVPVVSTKGATGHTLGAAGAIEAAFAILALEEQWIPPSLGATPRDPEVTLTVNEVRRPLRCRAILSNSFGFGGSNVAVLLGVS
jgi:3-oxoacyl-(acyl-carrier-protein) synthase